MKKIMFIVLIVSLFLISGCTEKVDNEDTEPELTESQELPENVEEIQETVHKTVEKLEEIQETIDQDVINKLKDRIQENENKFAMTESYFEMEKEEEKTIYFGIMNQEDEASDFTIEFFCDEAFDSRAEPKTDIVFEYTDTIEGLGKDQIEVMPLAIKMTEDAKPTDYNCKALVGPESYATKAFVITVV
jgi:hypothetical protein